MGKMKDLAIDQMNLEMENEMAEMHRREIQEEIRKEIQKEILENQSRIQESQRQIFQQGYNRNLCGGKRRKRGITKYGKLSLTERLIAETKALDDYHKRVKQGRYAIQK